MTKLRIPEKEYGPYDKTDGRQVIILKYSDGSRRTVSYPKWIMEKRLGRELDPDEETVDHIDRDFTNNEWWNLRVVERSRHVKEDAKRLKPAVFTCMMCETEFEKDASYVYTNRKDGKAGPFCSRKCAGIYGHKVKTGEIEKVEVNFEEFEAENKRYYRPLKREDGVGSVVCEECLSELGLEMYFKGNIQDEKCDVCEEVRKCVYIRSITTNIYYNPAYSDEEGPGFYMEFGNVKLRLTPSDELPDELKDGAKLIGTLELGLDP